MAGVHPVDKWAEEKKITCPVKIEAARRQFDQKMAKKMAAAPMTKAQADETVNIGKSYELDTKIMTQARRAKIQAHVEAQLKTPGIGYVRSKNGPTILIQAEMTFTAGLLAKDSAILAEDFKKDVGLTPAEREAIITNYQATK
jgi:hypothetical protein